MIRLAPALLALSALACGKQTFLAAAFVQTPSLPNPLDANNPFPQYQVLTAYFGTIDTRNPTQIDPSKLAPIANATGTVAFRPSGGADQVLAVPAAASPAGSYSLSSKDEPRLTFEVGQPYVLVLLTPGSSGEAFGARFVPAPPSDISEFKSSTCSVTLPLGQVVSADRCKDGTISQPLTITRTDAPSGGDFLPAFVMVGKIDPNNPTATPAVTYQTIPDSAGKLLMFVLSDANFRKQSFAIPGTAFAQSGYYLVSLLIVRDGTVSSNAFLGSTALAATGAAGILRVQ